MSEFPVLTQDPKKPPRLVWWSVGCFMLEFALNATVNKYGSHWSGFVIRMLWLIPLVPFAIWAFLHEKTLVSRAWLAAKYQSHPISLSIVILLFLWIASNQAYRIVGRFWYRGESSMAASGQPPPPSAGQPPSQPAPSPAALPYKGPSQSAGDHKKYAQALMNAYRKKHPLASLQEEADAVNSKLAKAGLTVRIKLRPRTPDELTSNSTKEEANRVIEALMNNYLREHPDAPHEGSTEEFQYVNRGLEAQGIPVRVGLLAAPCTKYGIKMYLNNSTVRDVKAYGCFTETGIFITGDKDDVSGLETAPGRPTQP